MRGLEGGRVVVPPPSFFQLPIYYTYPSSDGPIEQSGSAWAKSEMKKSAPDDRGIPLRGIPSTLVDGILQVSCVPANANIGRQRRDQLLVGF